MRQVLRGAAVALGLLATPACAEDGWANLDRPLALKSEIYLKLDCERPRSVKDFKVEADFEGALNVNAEGVGQISIVLAPTLSAHIPFAGKLNGPRRSAPGGYTSLRRLGDGSLELVWDLPNNALRLAIHRQGEICAADMQVVRRPGATQYTFFADTMYYCSRVSVLGATCRYN